MFEACSQQLLNSAICSVRVMIPGKTTCCFLCHDSHLLTIWFYGTQKFATITRKIGILAYLEPLQLTSLPLNQFLNEKV
jgi:hypothetical protein